MYAPRKKLRPVTCACPTCGRTLEDADLRVDLDANVLVCGDRSIGLQARQAELIWLLLDRYPECVDRDFIVSKVFADDVLYNTVTSTVSTARRELEKVGWTIKTERGIGYRLASVDISRRVIETARAVIAAKMPSDLEAPKTADLPAIFAT